MIATKFHPKRACEGADTIDHGDMRECPHEQCGVSVAWDMVDHSFWGFAASCPLKQRSGAGDGNQPPSGLREDPIGAGGEGVPHATKSSPLPSDSLSLAARALVQKVDDEH